MAKKSLKQNQRKSRKRDSKNRKSLSSNKVYAHLSQDDFHKDELRAQMELEKRRFIKAVEKGIMYRLFLRRNLKLKACFVKPVKTRAAGVKQSSRSGLTRQ